MREAGKKQLIIGLVIAGVGLAISVGSYAAASSGGGRSYFLMWGLVIFGLIRAFRGFSMMKAAGSTSNTATPPPSVAPGAPPVMPPQPPANTRPASAIDPMIAEPTTPASPPPPPASPSSIWD